MFQQILVSPRSDQLSFHEEEDLVKMLYRCNFLGNGYKSQVGVITLDITKDFVLGIPIDPGCKIVQQKDLWVQSQCPGQHDPLLLSARKTGSPFRDHGIEFLRKGFDKISELGRFNGLHQGFLLYGIVKSYIFSQADVEQDTVLEYKSQLLEEHFSGIVFNGELVDFDSSFIRGDQVGKKV